MQSKKTEEFNEVSVIFYDYEQKPTKTVNCVWMFSENNSLIYWCPKKKLLNFYYSSVFPFKTLNLISIWTSGTNKTFISTFEGINDLTPLIFCL